MHPSTNRAYLLKVVELQNAASRQAGKTLYAPYALNARYVGYAADAADARHASHFCKPKPRTIGESRLARLHRELSSQAQVKE